MKRWNDEKKLLFVTYYKEFECLWNWKSRLYKNKKARRDAYVSLQRQMCDDNLTIGAVQMKIKSLRWKYYQELKKIEDSKRSGDPSVIYKPSASWFYVMHSFLGEPANEYIQPVEDPQQTPTETSQTHTLPTQAMDTAVFLLQDTLQSNTTAAVNNIKLVPQNTNNYEDGTGITPTQLVLLNIQPQQANSNQEDTVTDQKLQVNNTPSSEKKCLSEANESIKKQTKKPSIPPWSAKKRQTNTESNAFSSFLERLGNISALVNTTREDDDEFHHFGMNVAAQLRILPLNVALQMQAEIQNSLFLKRVKYQNDDGFNVSSVAAISPQTNEHPRETFNIDNFDEAISFESHI